MRKAVIGGIAVLVLVVAALVVAPTITAQGSGRPGRQVLDLLMLQGPGSYIGVTVRELQASELLANKLEPGGVWIQTVVEASPAATAALRAGDIVTEFDGERVRGVRSFSRLVSETPPGRAVTMNIIRAGARQSVQITPEAGGSTTVERPDMAQLRERLRTLQPNATFSLPQALNRGERLGIALFPVNGQLAAYFGVQQGVLVSAVEDGSIAAMAGVRAGDVITTIAGQPVADVGDVNAAVRGAAPGTEVEIGLMRDRREMRVKATMPDRRLPEASVPPV